VVRVSVRTGRQRLDAEGVHPDDLVAEQLVDGRGDDGAGRERLAPTDGAVVGLQSDQRGPAVVAEPASVAEPFTLRERVRETHDFQVSDLHVSQRDPAAHIACAERSFDGSSSQRNRFAGPFRSAGRYALPFAVGGRAIPPGSGHSCAGEAGAVRGPDHLSTRLL